MSLWDATPVSQSEVSVVTAALSRNCRPGQTEDEGSETRAERYSGGFLTLSLRFSRYIWLVARRRAIYVTSSSRRAAGAQSTADESRTVADEGTNGRELLGEGGWQPASRRQPIQATVSFFRTHERLSLLTAGFLLAIGAAALYDLATPAPVGPSFEEIDRIVVEAFENYEDLPSVQSAAYSTIAASVVRVRQLAVSEREVRASREVPPPPSVPEDGPYGGAPDEFEEELAVGTGVVILDTGAILTSLHVVAGAERIGVIFADGSESDAVITSVQPENDLAVIQAQIVPEGLPPATLASTAGLQPGDPVVAVGFPFGVGPSVSAGIISGLGRSYRSLDGAVILDNLIQFDAAANPGNSGGPLVNRDGEVIGIVTSILNPTDDRVFVGIGFAVPIESAAAAFGRNPM